MRKLFVVTVGALVAVASLAPAAQARHRHLAKAAPTPMMAPVNPRIDAQGEFYATPVQAGDPTALLLAPLAVPGAVVGGVAQPVLAIPGEALAIPADLLPK